MKKLLIMLILTAFVLIPVTAMAITFGTPLKLKDPNPATNDIFGNATSISEKYALVGVPQNDTNALSNSGAAYVFNSTTGILLKSFKDPIPAVGDLFGSSVSVIGNRAVIGAPGNDTAGFNDAGAAFVFDVKDGFLSAVLNNPNPDNICCSNDLFGSSVSISGNNVVVGAPGNETGGWTWAGAAYLFSATGGNLLKPFKNPNPASVYNNLDLFGSSVSISGNNVLVGSPLNDTAGVSNSGAAYLFDATSGNLLKSFKDPNLAADDNFGNSVYINGTNVLIGAYRNATGSVSNSGAAYLFDATTGNLLASFKKPTTPVSGDEFGRSVSVSFNNLIIGAPGNDTAGFSDAGAAYLFPGTTSSSAGQTTGQVTVLGTCGISFVSGAPISYGSLAPGATSSNQTLVIDNTGSVNSQLDVRGSNWLDGSSVNQMNVGNTRFSTTLSSYSSKTPLTLTDQLVGTITPTTNLSSFWQLQVNLLNPSFSGSLTQTMDFTASC